MAAITRILSMLLVFFSPALANVEKTIFLGPEPISAPLTRPALADLRLSSLTPANGTLRTQLAAQFPTAAHPLGPATWLILDQLTPNQRYEVRVCWPATQPTAFQVDTFALSAVHASPDLLASLHSYAKTHHAGAASAAPRSTDGEASILLLRILAAADYFTADAALMRTVPPVDVDIILDPFLFNVLPRSLAGTVGYIVPVAVVAYLLAGKIASWIEGLIVASGTRHDKKTQ
ncbi:hypothetical protein BT67DRAFT_443327 [Trichocladium antarcticum]|uniref:Uncharacterized protein n=1 Tax=Trichocladium antarcticum TaxID=1450529 RepID=A0AAN6ZCP0_9PEZI|nr:hypothetical protein BT67DRAFT_443327 [Trichocladium antarcticum]